MLPRWGQGDRVLDIGGRKAAVFAAAVAIAVGSTQRASADGDCNANTIPDAFELAMGLLIDANGNGTPDECEAVGDQFFYEWSPQIGQPGVGRPAGNAFVGGGLRAFDDGSGVALYAGGNFTEAGGVAANFIARWDGSAWSAVGDGTDGPVYALAVFDDASGPALYAAGEFSSAGGLPASNIARWDGKVWAPLAAGLNGKVDTLLVVEENGSPVLYAGGGFTAAGGMAANRIARWDGSDWSAVGSGVNGWVFGLAAMREGSETAIFATGAFTEAGGVAANRVAKWDGATWSSLGDGVNATAFRGIVFDDGTGPALFVGGDFTAAGGVAANRVAKWDGEAWISLGAGMNNWVRNFQVFDDGSGGGPSLYACGWFTTADGMPASRIARWDGSGWHAVGGGAGGTVEVLAVANFGNGGPSLFAGGGFASIEGVDAGGIAERRAGLCGVIGVEFSTTTVPASGGSVEITIETNGPQCEWSISTFSGGYPPYTSCGSLLWPCSGVGSSVFVLEVDPNPYEFPASIQVYIDLWGEVTLTVEAASCAGGSFSEEALAYDWTGGSATLAWEHNCGSPPDWPAASQPWVEVTGFECGQWKYCNGGTVSYAVAPFTGVGERTATVTISGGVHTITQSGQADCNGNGLGDLWEIKQGIASDLNGNGIPDSCDCPADYDGSGIVDGADIGLLLLQWNTASSAFDLTGDGVVDGADLGILLLQWGLCP